MPSAIIRGSAIQAVSSSPFSVSWPAGTETGDLAIVFCGNQDAITNPSGWTDGNNTFGGANWAGAIFYKVLTSGDITAGSLSVSAGGTGVCCIVTLINGTFSSSSPVREVDPSRNSSGSSSISLNTSSNIASTDLLLFFGSNLATSENTVNAGTQIQQLSSADGSGCLYAESGVSGEQTITISYSTPGSGNYQAIVAIEIGNVSYGVLAETQIDAPISGGTAGDFFRFRLRNFAGTVPQIFGFPITITATTAAGTMSQDLWPNTALSPSSTWWTVETWSNGRLVTSNNYVFTGTVDLSNATPI